MPTATRALNSAVVVMMAMSLTYAQLASSADNATPMPTPGATVQRRLLDDKPVVIAHRGCWREPAENSLEGLQNCAKLGVDFVEIDLRETADGVVVLLHDETLDRTTSMHGRLRNFQYKDLSNARLREGQGGSVAPLTRAVLPSLEDVLRAQLPTFLFLDIKEPIHPAVYRLIEKHDAQNRVLVSLNRQFAEPLLRSGFPGRVAIMPKLDQYENGVCLPDAAPLASLANYAEVKADIYEAVFCDDDYLRDVVSAARGRKVWVNTLGPRFVAGRTEEGALESPVSVWGDLLDLGASAIQTDHPRELLIYLNQRRLR